MNGEPDELDDPDHREQPQALSDAELAKLSDEEIKDHMRKLFHATGLDEVELRMRQPLLDLGWRLDYEKKGITRPGVFIPLEDLRETMEAIELVTPRNAEPSALEWIEARQLGLYPRLPRWPGRWYIPFLELCTVVQLLEKPSKPDHREPTP
jgi:hypothetical protein